MARKNKEDSISSDEVLPALLRSNMLRMILTKHIELNKLADSKASMLITAASIVMAITFTASGETTDKTMIMVMLVSSIIAIVFAIFVIIPKPYNRNTKCRNLLYFRSFSDLSEDEYVTAMKEMMVDKQDMYEQYIRDIYQYGHVTLTKKYRWLTAGLVLFLVGLSMGGAILLFRFFQG